MRPSGVLILSCKSKISIHCSCMQFREQIFWLFKLLFLAGSWKNHLPLPATREAAALPQVLSVALLMSGSVGKTTKNN